MFPDEADTANRKTLMKKIVLLFEHKTGPDEQLVNILEGALADSGNQVYVDRHLKISVDWARSVDEKIRNADAVIVALSGCGPESEMLGYELEVANDAKLRNRSMKLIFVPIGADAAIRGSSGPLLGGYQTEAWESPASTATIIAEILDQLRGNETTNGSEVMLGSTGGGISTASPFYIERDADQELKAMLEAGEATTLVKGARQSGKTSLLAQGLKWVREAGHCACVTDFQRLGSNLYASENEFYKALAANLARQMRMNYELDWDWGWDDIYGPTSNLDEFVRSMLVASNKRVVWFMDEADWLFASTFADSFFALVRSWHNARALAADELWSKFSVVIAYATEAHLFIQDINQSPFNVGRRLELKGFSLRQTEELNKRYGAPLRGIDQVSQVQELLDGQPFLTRTAFDSLLRSNGNLRGFLGSADREDGPFGDHLRRVLVSVTQLSTVRNTMQRALSNEFLAGSPEIDRLVAAGILVKNSSGNHIIRCKLYRKYLERHLA